MKGIKTLSGHLTATNKRILLTMLDKGMMSARTPKIRYYITEGLNGIYRVVTIQNELRDCGVMGERQSMADFTLTP